jgi:hypothetical protein
MDSLGSTGAVCGRATPFLFQFFILVMDVLTAVF